jgi:phosphate transport system permease protein
MSHGKSSSGGAPRRRTIDAVTTSLPRRYASERRFRLLGRLAVLTGLVFVGSLFLSIVLNGYTGFEQTYIKLPVSFDQEILDPAGTRDPASLAGADYGSLVKKVLQAAFPEVSGRSELRELYGLVSSGAEYQLLALVAKDPSLVGTTRDVWLLGSDDLDMVVKGHIDRSVPESERRVSDRVLGWLDALEAKGAVETRFNWSFFTNGDSREPELAGIGGAVMGSFYTLLVCLVIAFPIGVAAAVYLEEFAPKNRLTDLIEVNINNLAAVPSIVFGLLGLAVLINFFGLPRSAPVVGGLVLALMVLPTIIIAGRAALKSVPPSIREAALGVGASKMQTVFHHVLPLAMPGMMTGMIIGMAHALGETAPLLMIGMVAFVVDVPKGFFDPSTLLPVQIFLWADSPERAFVEKTAAAIIVLLAFLIAMNALAVYLRRRFERRW